MIIWDIRISAMTKTEDVGVNKETKYKVEIKSDEKKDLQDVDDKIKVGAKVVGSKIKDSERYGSNFAMFQTSHM